MAIAPGDPSVFGDDLGLLLSGIVVMYGQNVVSAGSNTLNLRKWLNYLNAAVRAKDHAEGKIMGRSDEHYSG